MSRNYFLLLKSNLINNHRFMVSNKFYSNYDSISSHVEDLRGIFPQLTTPFDRRGEKIDWRNLEQNLTQLNENKFSGMNLKLFNL